MSVSVSVCVRLSAIISSELRVRSSPDFFRARYMFAHKPGLLDVAAQLKRSARAALGLAINCAQ